MSALERLLDMLEQDENVVVGRFGARDSRYYLSDGRGPGIRGDSVEGLAECAIARLEGRLVIEDDQGDRFRPEPAPRPAPRPARPTGPS